MKYKLLILKILLISTATFAQKEGNIWYFGNGAGLDFNSGTPVALTNGVMNTGEGCSVISDHSGNLLFYTDGTWVWNRNHVLMPNGFGLMGHTSSIQSALIVQDPGDSNKYYIFTVPAQPFFYGEGRPLNFYYNVVDMSLNGGFGDVAGKNILLLEHVTEKLTAVRHANGHDIWVIAHEYETDGFAAFLVTCSGVDTIPVMSHTGTVHIKDLMDNNMIGQMKISADGKKLALSILDMGIMELFDFDNAVGTVSNPVTLPRILENHLGWFYGVEFSPDGTKLYGSLIASFRIYQYDLMAGSATDIINSRTLVGTSPGTFTATSTSDKFGALQLGPDGKIYAARYPRFFLGAINKPNASGTACNYVSDAVFLGGRTSQVGLPSFMQSHFYPQFNYATCAGDSTFFFITNTNSIDSVHWDFGDPASGVSNTSSDISPYHLFSAYGNYIVQLTKYSGACTSVFSRTVTITDPYPPVDLGNDTSLCSFTTLLLNAEIPNSTYLWQDSSTNSTFTVSSPGTYWVEVTSLCNKTSDTVKIEYLNPDFSMSIDPASALICKDDSIQLEVITDTSFSYTYSWSPSAGVSDTGIANPVVKPLTTTTYFVTVTPDSGCFARDSISVTVISFPTIHLTTSDTAVCSGSTFEMNAVFYPNECNITTDTCTGIISTATIGTDTTYNSSTNYPAPYGARMQGARHQFLYLASELQEMNVGNKITGIAFDVASLNATNSSFPNTTYKDFEIRIKCSNTSSFSSIEETGLYTVFPAQDITIAPGWNTHQFSDYYEWDGLSNIVIEICFVNSSLSFSGNSSTRYSSTGFNSCMWKWGGSEVCGSGNFPISNLGTNRPNTRFNSCVTPPPPMYNFYWSPGGSLSDSTVYNPVTIPKTSTNYTFNLTDNGCMFSDTVSVLVYQISMDVNSTATDCFGGNDGSASVNVSGGSGSYSYSWSPGGQTDYAISNMPAGNYTVTVTNNTTNCTYDTIVTIEQPPAMAPEFLVEAERCNFQDGSVLVSEITNGTAPFTYSWNGGPPVTSNRLKDLQSGIYQIVITDAKGCTITDSVLVGEVIMSMKADFGYELIPCTNEIQFLNLSSDTTSSHWDFGDGATSNEISPLHTFQANEKYTVILILAPGSACADTAQAIIPFENDAVSDTFFIPNVFTPNGDGKNDYFEIIGIDDPCFKITKLMIFNRWGMKIFEAEGKPLRWDGISNGNELKEGIYFYVLEGEGIRRSGSVTLLR